MEKQRRTVILSGTWILLYSMFAGISSFFIAELTDLFLWTDQTTVLDRLKFSPKMLFFILFLIMGISGFLLLLSGGIGVMKNKQWGKEMSVCGTRIFALYPAFLLVMIFFLCVCSGDWVLSFAMLPPGVGFFAIFLPGVFLLRRIKKL